MAFWGAVARFPVDVVLWHVDSFRGFQRPPVPYPRVGICERRFLCATIPLPRFMFGTGPRRYFAGSDQRGRCIWWGNGECSYCDEQRASGNMVFPPHDPSRGCEFKSGDPHCYCDSCF